MTPDLQTLRLTVLELMGWEFSKRGDPFIRTNGKVAYLINRNKLPDPTTSLSDCEPLLEEMRKAGLLVAMTTDSKGWHCGIGDDSGAIYNGKAESLPVAICLVFAKWNGAK